MSKETEVCSMEESRVAKKMLIIRPGDIQELSFEEVLDRYEKLICNRARKWTNFYEFDEMKQIGNIGLWKAYEKYDSERLVGFGQFADVVITNDFHIYHRKNMQRHVKDGAKVKQIISTDMPVTDDENVCIIDTLNDDVDFVDELIDRDTAKGLMKELHSLRSSDERVMTLYLMGNTQVQIGKIIDRTQAQVSRQIKRSVETIRKAYARNERMCS